MARRSAMKVVAGVVLAAAVGFLVAALWSWLANELDWGPTLASLAVGGGFALIGIIILIMSSRPRHEMPTGDDLRKEVEARVTLAADAAVNRVQGEALRMADMAENKVHALMDQAGFRANRLASETERRAQGFVRDAAQTVGLTSGNLRAARDGAGQATDKLSDAANSNAGSMAKLIGAFAIGVTVAAKLKESRQPRYDFDEDDFL